MKECYTKKVWGILLWEGFQGWPPGGALFNKMAGFGVATASI